jgi:hypothetical protein
MTRSAGSTQSNAFRTAEDIDQCVALLQPFTGRREQWRNRVTGPTFGGRVDRTGCSFDFRSTSRVLGRLLSGYAGSVTCSFGKSDGGTSIHCVTFRRPINRVLGLVPFLFVPAAIATFLFRAGVRDEGSAELVIRSIFVACVFLVTAALGFWLDRKLAAEFVRYDYSTRFLESVLGGMVSRGAEIDQSPPIDGSRDSRRILG